MNLLLIGGGRFAGRHLAEMALAAGHQLTLFNRGQSDAVPPVGARLLRGDRRGDLSALANGRWDAVVDFCGYLPSEVAAMASLLRLRARHYCFVSSLSVYAQSSRPNDEDSPLGEIEDTDCQVVDGRSYGPLKALCEQALLREFGAADSLIVRPGLIVGPRDPTQRFTWWPARLGRSESGQPLLCPGAPDVPIQFIDGRDLAAFILQALVGQRSGIYNAASMADAWTWGDLIQACEAAAGVQARQVWIDSERLLALGVEPWKDLPLWIPATGDSAAFLRCDTSRAHAAGLHCRPLAQTVADTLDWWRSLPEADRAFTQAGLAPERESALLAALG